MPVGQARARPLSHFCRDPGHSYCLSIEQNGLSEGFFYSLNVQIEGRAAFGASHSNAILCI